MKPNTPYDGSAPKAHPPLAETPCPTVPFFGIPYSGTGGRSPLHRVVPPDLSGGTKKLIVFVSTFSF
ncbi:MAG: hypothetical protein HY088_06630 [Ignavibacteriales bacterium]|nr:hypothetical protein [Ignavibacteriales bacterium]